MQALASAPVAGRHFVAQVLMNRRIQSVIHPSNRMGLQRPLRHTLRYACAIAHEQSVNLLTDRDAAA